MSELETQDQTKRSVKRLTVAVWVLSVVTVINLGVSLFAALFPPFIAQRITASMPESPLPKMVQEIEEFQNFSQLSVENQIAGASVIVLSTWKKEDGKLKCIISEILKQKPGTIFHYRVGDEYTSASRYPQERTSYGDGLVMLFTGSPASMRLSASYTGDRIGGLGDMPLGLFREMVNTIVKVSSQDASPRQETRRRVFIPARESRR